MNEHVFDDLPQLLTGEADRATVVAVTAHLRECDDCRDELIGVVAAHAALRSAARFAPEVITGPVGDDAPLTAVPGPAALIDLSAVFAQVRAEADMEAQDRSPAKARHSGSRRRPPTAWLVAAAAVVVLAVGGGATALAVHGSSSSQPSRALALAAYGEGTNPATARLIGDNKMQLNASSLPALASGNYYEVWLTNGARTEMAPIGVLNSDRTASFTVPASEMNSFAAVEVSVQATAGVGAYSGHSVLRGTYA